MVQSHDATQSMLGYLYQCRYALLRGLEEGKNHAGHALTIEKFDDVAFEDDGEPIELIQTKHHGKPGNTSDKSVDLWKTLAIWISRVEGDPTAAANTRFVFLTTNTATPESALAKLRQTGGDRDVAGAIALMLGAASESASQQTDIARSAFLAMDAATRKLLVQNIWVFDQAPNIINVREKLENLLFFAAPKDKIKVFTDYLEGWWFKRVINALNDPAESSIPITAIQDKLDELRENFQLGRLPLDESIDAMPPVTVLPDDDRAFVRQLRLISLSDKSILAAVHDYYRSSEQRSRWARENLLLDGEAEKYDRALCDAWNRRFAADTEDTDSYTDDAKQKLGRGVFHWASSFQRPLRNRDELWLSSGSFQILSDTIRVGWHPDFEEQMSDDGSAP